KSWRLRHSCTNVETGRCPVSFLLSFRAAAGVSPAGQGATEPWRRNLKEWARGESFYPYGGWFGAGSGSRRRLAPRLALLDVGGGVLRRARYRFHWFSRWCALWRALGTSGDDAFAAFCSSLGHGVSAGFSADFFSGVDVGNVIVPDPCVPRRS